MAVYASDPLARPDTDFEPGALHHLVPGVQGRLLDPRRTPVSVSAVRLETGFVDIRIEGFEDAGAIWEMPLERVGDFQFERDGPRASDATVAAMKAAIERFSGDEIIEATAQERERTERRIAERRREAAGWLGGNSRFVRASRSLPAPSSRRGDPDLAADLEAWLLVQGTWDIEQALTRSFVSNPRAGEIVKGHRIVLAELGLADYHGPTVRDPATFEGTWTHERRAEHIVARLAFLRALFDRLRVREVTVWRGASIEDRLEARSGRTFVSTSFDEAVARSHFESGAAHRIHVLTRQDVPIERLFMTYHETAAMNTVFLEAEAVVLARTGDGWA